MQPQTERLQRNFKTALDLYHKAGRDNGGGVDGVQLPPGVAAEQLDGFIGALSTFLAEQPDIDVIEPPAGVTEASFRKLQIAQTMATVAANRQAYIETAVRMIHNPAVATMVAMAIEHAPAQFMLAKAVNGGGFHPPDELNVGGLALHSLRDVIMGAKVIDFYNQDASVNVVGNQHISGDTRDVILGALVLHDIAKGADTWTMAHGPDGAKILKGLWKDAPSDFAAQMEDLVANHMAQWNRTPEYAPDPRPPQNISQQVVSYGDFLGSLAHIFVQPFPGRDE